MNYKLIGTILIMVFSTSIDAQKCRVAFDGVDEFTGKHLVTMKSLNVSRAYKMVAEREDDIISMRLEVSMPGDSDWTADPDEPWFFKMRDGTVLSLSPIKQVDSKYVYDHLMGATQTGTVKFIITTEDIEMIRGKKLDKIRPGIDERRTFGVDKKLSSRFAHRFVCLL